MTHAPSSIGRIEFKVILTPAVRTNESLLARLEPDATSLALGRYDFERRLHCEHAVFEDSPLDGRAP